MLHFRTNLDQAMRHVGPVNVFVQGLFFLQQWPPQRRPTFQTRCLQLCPVCDAFCPHHMFEIGSVINVKPIGTALLASYRWMGMAIMDFLDWECSLQFLEAFLHRMGEEDKQWARSHQNKITALPPWWKRRHWNSAAIDRINAPLDHAAVHLLGSDVDHDSPDLMWNIIVAHCSARTRRFVSHAWSSCKRHEFLSGLFTRFSFGQSTIAFSTSRTA